MSKKLASVAVLFSICFSVPSLAKDDQNRRKLIGLHEKMAKQHIIAAKCLKSGKSVDHCNNEAMKGCPMMDSGHCPFMNNNMTGGKDAPMDK